MSRARPCLIFSSLFIRFLSLFFAADLYAQSSVWSVEKDGNKLYLGGTMHVLSAADFPLPPEYDQAYMDSQTLVFETDLAQMNTLTTQARIMSAMMYGDGRTLSTVLSAETHQLLSQQLASRGMPIALMEGFSAGGISLMLTVLELQQLGFGLEGVDQFYHSKALADNKNLDFLESIEQQINFIRVLGEGIEEEVILHTLNDLEQLPGLMDGMRNQWRNGDLGGMEESMLAELKAEFSEVYKVLMSDRNNAWMPKIESMLQSPEIEFVLVGGAHMVGTDGLIAQLQSLGYSIEQI